MMHCMFGWGATPSEMKVQVKNHNIVKSCLGGGERNASIQPEELHLVLDFGLDVEEWKKFLKFERNQLSEAEKNGAGKIAVYLDEEADAPLYDIVFERSWVIDSQQNTSEHSDTIEYVVRIAPTVLTVAGEKLVHSARQRMFLKKSAAA